MHPLDPAILLVIICLQVNNYESANKKIQDVQDISLLAYFLIKRVEATYRYNNERFLKEIMVQAHNVYKEDHKVNYLQIPPGIPSAVKARRPNHWTAREIPQVSIDR